jgi:uncharacterized membrane protein
MEVDVRLKTKLFAVAPVAAAVLLMISSSAALAAGPDLDLHSRMGRAGFFPFGLIGGLGGLVLLASFILLIVWLIRALSGSNSWRQGFAVSPVPTPQSPLDILSRRFAAGEITAEEFQSARDVLREASKP